MADWYWGPDTMFCGPTADHADTTTSVGSTNISKKATDTPPGFSSGYQVGTNSKGTHICGVFEIDPMPDWATIGEGNYTVQFKVRNFPAPVLPFDLQDVFMCHCNKGTHPTDPCKVLQIIAAERGIGLSLAKGLNTTRTLTQEASIAGASTDTCLRVAFTCLQSELVGSYYCYLESGAKIVTPDAALLGLPERKVPRGIHRGILRGVS